MLLMFTGILFVLITLIQIVLDSGERFWKDAMFWMLFASMSVLSYFAISESI